MMSEWKKYKLRDIVTINNKSIDRDYPFQEIEYLDTGSITENKIEKFQKNKISEIPSRAKRLVVHNDIIYSTVRPIHKHFGFIQNPQPNLVVSTGFAVISAIKKIVNPKLLYYFLSNEEIVNYLDMIAEASTSAYPSLRPSDILALDIFLPPLSEQAAIAEVLCSLDDKIDLLHRQNSTIEKLASMLFRQWFIEEENGWEVRKIDSVVTIKGGGTPSTTNPAFWNGNMNWTSPRDLSRSNNPFLFDTEKKITALGLKKISSGLLPVGTLLLSSRAPIGYLALTEIPVAINQGYIAMICNKGFSKYYMYLWVKQNMDLILNAANGSVFDEISKTIFRDLDFLIPPKEVIQNIENEIEPLFEKIKSNAQQIKTLTQLRNTLLPKLMNGTVKVSG